jgi:hypothetical protein
MGERNFGVPSLVFCWLCNPKIRRGTCRVEWDDPKIPIILNWWASHKFCLRKSNYEDPTEYGEPCSELNVMLSPGNLQAYVYDEVRDE